MSMGWGGASPGPPSPQPAQTGSCLLPSLPGGSLAPLGPLAGCVPQVPALLLSVLVVTLSEQAHTPPGCEETEVIEG